MTLPIASLLDDVMDRAEQLVLSSERHNEVVEVHDCDGCGVSTSNVDLWTEDSETCEELWLCKTCCEW